MNLVSICVSSFTAGSCDGDNISALHDSGAPSADGDVKVSNIGSIAFLEFETRHCRYGAIRYENNSVGSPLYYKVGWNSLKLQRDIIAGSVSCMMVKGSAVDAPDTLASSLRLPDFADAVINFHA